MQATCQCGQLSATIEEGAEAMTIACHCRDCQKRSGSPFGVIAYFPSEAVTIHGEAREFTRPTDTGATFSNGFCPKCGSSVYARAGKYPSITGIMVGAMSDPVFPQPVRSVYEQSKHSWIEFPADVTKHQRGRDS